jgi:hypothetical protein
MTAEAAEAMPEPESEPAEPHPAQLGLF